MQQFNYIITKLKELDFNNFSFDKVDLNDNKIINIKYLNESLEFQTPKLIIESLIKENNQKYQNELNSLHLLTDSLNQEVITANSKTDSLRTSISIRNRELNKLRKKYNETVATIDSMSNDELAKFLTDRYK